MFKMSEFTGREFKTGDVVRISNAYFKNDNGLYFVIHSPGDPSWCGRDFCLRRVSKTGKPHKDSAIAFWPLTTFVSNYEKCALAREWNRENAVIEAAEVKSMDEIRAVFAEEAEKTNESIENAIWRWGWDENGPDIAKYKAIRDFYKGLADNLSA
jgi:hypothetical protein